ncbi:thialysine N-epsilon-acetyltransferase [Onthophagus taurus]|uniref:thialysine N-epsilon-acetyltransferase n=1 Tax=Onthophagus taurus TaxID=166361 RepID=UPI000C2072BE|nr:diamine acetyltransferase 2 [Onthophagus taurus]
MKEFLVRKAKKEDMKDVYEMIKGLAIFEKMPNEVKISPETLQKDGFGPNPTFHCFVAELNSEIIGFTIYYYCYSTWLGTSIFLEDLFVKEEFRKQGVGEELFKKVAKLAHESSHRLDFHVLRWNPAVDFYKKLGAIDLTKTEEWHLYRLNDEALNKLFS